MDILKFLKSINDGKTHEFKDKDLSRALKGKNAEYNKILELKAQGLVDYGGVPLGGHPALGSYWITTKGKQYIKENSKFNKFKKPF